MTSYYLFFSIHSDPTMCSSKTEFNVTTLNVTGLEPLVAYTFVVGVVDRPALTSDEVVSTGLPPSKSTS